jgi:DNA processing protein
MPSYDQAAAIFLGLSQVKGVGFKTLLELGGVAEAAHKIARGDLDPFLREHVPKSSIGIEEVLIELGEQMIAKLRAAGVQLIRYGDPFYPSRFLDLPEASRPRWLFCRGNFDLLGADTVAVVGTRSPSIVGEFLTKFTVSVLAEDGLPVVSGLAKGIDAIAHEWALVSGIPTVSILGTGILRPYPSSNVHLADYIVEEGGLLISEYLPYSEPTGQHFVLRNRLQAALARAVIAPEWRRSSGTAHTIRFAKSMARPTVSLSMEGLSISPEHGEADHAFIVPRQHDAFRSLVRKALVGAIPSNVSQTDLFGG